MSVVAVGQLPMVAEPQSRHSYGGIPIAGPLQDPAWEVVDQVVGHVCWFWLVTNSQDLTEN